MELAQAAGNSILLLSIGSESEHETVAVTPATTAATAQSCTPVASSRELRAS